MNDPSVATTANQFGTRAVGQFWMEEFLLDAASAAKPPDCLNVVAESDFRAYTEDVFALPRLYKEKGWDETWQADPNNPHARDAPYHAHWWSDRRDDGLPSCFPSWITKRQDPGSNQEELVNDFLRQLHVLCTAAHRWKTHARPKGSGELICLGWKPHGKSPTYHWNMKRNDKPGRWTGLWAITTRCAREILRIKAWGGLKLPPGL